MFFDDRIAALAEMWRVLRPGGRLVVAVWDGSSGRPAMRAMMALLERLFGAEVARALEAPFVVGDQAAFAALLAAAGIPGAVVETGRATARFASIADWVRTDIKGWTLAEQVDDAGYARLQAAAATELARFAGADGAVAFPAPALFGVARKP